ncbi:hypothetical protein PMI04_004825 [Sphingobium sp. AP49]|uniref:hypothetical protein n=1 Tax=Sphingobium sp. AP49 TaxID=1144307 RepID=UPI00026ECB43|nr:hypothetical protein [Sphingobium sp. AP49]WHO39920.1 hypothetical protein PMI04_004825 [Sphingobium sp. AP49]
MGKRIAMVAMMLGLASCSAERSAQAPTENTSASVDNMTVEGAAENSANAVDNAATGLENAANGASEEIWCAAARATMSAAECQSLTQQRDSLEQGVAAFNPPRTMMRDEPTRVVLAIGSEAESAETVRAAGGPPSGAQVAPVRIGRYMSATLSGSAFTITPIGEAKRDLGMSGSEQWEWDVTPTREGDQTLQVRVESFAQDAQGHATRLKLYQSSPIAVSVTVTDRQKRSAAIGTMKGDLDDTTGLFKSLRGWLLALAGVIVAASLVVWRMRGFGKKPDDDKNDPTGS